MHSLFVTATGTNVGKTHTTLALIELFAQRGLRVGVYKPIETGVDTIAPDATLLLEACQKVNPRFAHFSTQDITAYTFSLPAAPFCADTTHTIDITHIIQKRDALLQYCDILLIEGAGGLMVPLTKDFLNIDLIQALKAEMLLVTPSRLGCINETLLSIEALNTRHLPFEWCVNLFEEKERFVTVTKPYYDATFKEWWCVNEGLQRYVSAYRL